MPPKRALWSEADLIAAVRAVQRGTLSTYKAAERYKVPRRTIRNHLQSGSLKKSLGRKPILNDEEEAQLAQRIIRYSEIGLPLSQLKRNDFYDLLPTPVKVQTCTPTVRRKAINYRGTPVTKYLFDKYNQEKINDKEVKGNKRKKNKQDENFTDVETTGRKEKTKFNRTLNTKKAKMVSEKKSATVKGKSQKQVSWFCYACKEDRMDDAMRLCSRCSKWYHEECVGLTAEDTDDFQCPDGCK